VLVKGRLKRPGGNLSESTLRSTALLATGEGREGAPGAAAPAAQEQAAAPDIGPVEPDVIATVESASTAGEKPAAEPPAAKPEQQAAAATAEDVEVLDIETLVDLRDTAGDHQNEGEKPKK
jgi:hypothetical protein